MQSFTAKDAKDAKEHKSLTAKAAKEQIFEDPITNNKDAKTAPSELLDTPSQYGCP
jgi:hypothetical protein